MRVPAFVLSILPLVCSCGGGETIEEPRTREDLGMGSSEIVAGSRSPGSLEASNGRCIDIPGAVPSNGAVLTVYDCLGQINQAWTYMPSGQIMGQGGLCLDINSSNQAMVATCDDLRVSQHFTLHGGFLRTAMGCLRMSGSGDNGSVVMAATCSSADPTQIWRHHAQTDLRDSQDAACFTLNTPVVQMATCMTQGNQRWSVQPDGRIVNHAGMCLGVTASNTIEIKDCASANVTWTRTGQGWLALSSDPTTCLQRVGSATQAGPCADASKNVRVDHPLWSVITIPVHAIAAKDVGQVSSIFTTPANLTSAIEQLNDSVRPFGIRYTFDPVNDFRTVTNTRLNREFIRAAGEPLVHPPGELTRRVFYLTAGHLKETWLPDSGTAWATDDLSGAINPVPAPDPAGKIAVYTINEDYETRLAYRTTSGHLITVHKSGNGAHSWQDLTAVLPGLAAVDSDPTSYVTYDRATNTEVQHIVYRSGLALHDCEAGTTWSCAPILGTGDVYGNPSAHVVHDSAMVDMPHVVYRGTGGVVNAAYRVAGTWNSTAIGAAAMAPVASGDPVGFVELDPSKNPGEEQHVFYRSGGRLYELYWGSTWQYRDLGVVNSVVGNPSVFRSKDFNVARRIGLNVTARDSIGHIHTWELSGGSWLHRDLTATYSLLAAASDPTSYASGFEQTAHIFYASTSNQLRELWRREGSSVWNSGSPAGSTAVDASTAVVGAATIRKHLGNDDERDRYAAQNPDKLTLIFATGRAFSPTTATDTDGGANFSNALTGSVVLHTSAPSGNLIMHESGHFLHLGHVFGPLAQARQEADGPRSAEYYLESYINGVNGYSAHPSSQALDVFDGDGLLDTPPDPGEGAFGALNACDPSVWFNVLTNSPLGRFAVDPDRFNSMSYYFGCPYLVNRYSAMQMQRARDALLVGNRSLLVH